MRLFWERYEPIVGSINHQIEKNLGISGFVRDALNMKELDIHIELLLDPSQVPIGLLKLADPSILQIESYLKSGTCYTAKLRSKIIGILVLKEIDSNTMEIKNIAIQES